VVAAVADILVYIKMELTVGQAVVVLVTQAQPAKAEKVFIRDQLI
jgi:hypothetical protein